MANKLEWVKIENDGSMTSPEVGGAWSKLNTPSYASAKFGNGQNISATNRWHKGIASGLKKFTIDFWFKTGQNSSTTEIFWGDAVGGYSAFYNNGGGTLRFNMTSVSGFPRGVLPYDFTSLSYSAGDLVWFGISIDLTKSAGNKIRMFQAVNSGSVTELTRSAYTEYVGGDFSDTGYAPDIAFGAGGYTNSGVIDDFVVWDDVLTTFPYWNKEGRVAPVVSASPIIYTYGW
jgi:hypothetical protein